ncbi:eCIS core domain-containing protein [Rhodococcus koreensis]
MREHGYDNEESALRPRSSRIDGPDRPSLAAAALRNRDNRITESGIAELQRTVGNTAVSSMLDDEPSPVHDVVGSVGRPLEPDVRVDMESRMGHDFGDVRVHDDAAADHSAKAVNAHAYTVGSDITFQRDAYDPTSVDGRTTLAHELTHVVQQRSGPVDGTPAAGGISISDPADRFEREAAANAERVAGPAADSPAPAPAPAAVQRQDAPAPDEEREEDEASVQGLFVQRDEEIEDETS